VYFRRVGFWSNAMDFRCSPHSEGLIRAGIHLPMLLCIKPLELVANVIREVGSSQLVTCCGTGISDSAVAAFTRFIKRLDYARIRNSHRRRHTAKAA